MTRDEKWLLDEKYLGRETPEYFGDKRRLATGEPLAYVIGWQPFLGLKIYLDSRPLIPRPETEWWTEGLLKKMSGSERPTVFLDLCAGSGAIGCAVLKNIQDAQVYFGEIDPAHEATIFKNIRGNNLDESRAHFGIGDLFQPLKDLRFDVIAVNPPYIPINRELPASVTDYEPARALYAGTDGLDIIRKIATELRAYLTRGGTAWIECDSAHAEAARALFLKQEFRAVIKDDQFGVPRVVEVSYS
ncbi:hypothetical protein A2678_02035 [Candidatus Kaiserbacteria bacterium RIFCSPHIGHO2_01_FULL_53_31]|uniref:peptide chain release factor N(5)-glutamine methyltransferase n=1 Tax=Candidatus Kaiserbacteria bacterium RIFCSPHIGHO2_01_FULL_53_31 TaxID=1798481 RepID=A0A1F6CHH7_9BACT|nr:MAG: hypothetical protein A2678_02035 [Candidatus Kaiserbacteria bacterium RIFCSPHIGHO2_01_FULL_53_31]